MAKKEDTVVDEAPAQEGVVARTWYMVLHSGVAEWWRGQTISDLHLVGHDIARLLRLGAIAEVGSDAQRDAEKEGLPAETPEGVPTTDDVLLLEKTAAVPPLTPVQTSGAPSSSGGPAAQDEKPQGDAGDAGASQ